MPLRFIKGDITKIECDAIVNAANSTLLGGGGVDGAIHRAAGPGLYRECKKLGGCETGNAKLTKGYALKCKYVIHTVGPVWEGGSHGEEQLLRNCYRNSLQIAASKKCRSLSFPLISSGIYGYPKDRALKVAVEEISEFLLQKDDTDMLVYLVFLDTGYFKLDEQYNTDISEEIDKYSAFIVQRRAADSAARKYSRRESFGQVSDEIPPAPSMYSTAAMLSPGSKTQFKPSKLEDDALENQSAEAATELYAKEFEEFQSLVDALGEIDESFSEMLLRKIDEKGLTDAQCYKKANIDRRLFSRIRSDRLYRPSKNTALAFAIALELPLSETKEMLLKAGFALSHSNKFDIIVEYFIKRGNYNIFEINEALFAYDQSLLGV